MYNENGEKTKRILQLAAIGAIAIVLVGVVVLGMVTGHWPWEKEDQSGDHNGMPSQSITDTAGEEDTTGEALPEDVTTQGTVPGDTTAKPTEGGNSGSGQNGGGSNMVDFDSLKPSTAPTKPDESATKPTEKPTESTEATTKPTGVEIDIPLF